MDKLIGLSLFANIGVAEAYLKDIDVNIVLANEIDEKRSKFYKHVYPETEMVCGDITKDEVFDRIVKRAKELGVNFIMATPPCQGMSTAGKMDPKDPRNQLITYAIKAINEIKPNFVLLENVQQQLKTRINYGDMDILIPDYIKAELKKDYFINDSIINASSYGVPQSRERSIFIMVKYGINVSWEFPDPIGPIITLREAIGHLPSIDPIIQGMKHEELLKYFPEFDKKVLEGQKISKWHKPPKHKLRHVRIMRYTPEGKSAFENEIHYPQKDNGERITGYLNTYKRQCWDRPAYTVTTYNGAICSHDNVHPGRPIGIDINGDKIYSDPRVLTIYELLIVMSLPTDWNIPDWADESLIRHSIGEGIPPLVIKKIVQQVASQI